MTTNSVSPTDLVKRLNSRFRENPAWRELFAATSRVINEYVTRPREALATVRDPKAIRRGQWLTLNNGERVVVNHVSVQETEVVVHAQTAEGSKPIEFTVASALKPRRINIDGARFHGFHYFSDTLSDTDYARVHEWVERYWPESGTPQFVNFIGFVKNMALNVDHLFSDETTDPFEAEISTTDGITLTKTGITDTVHDHYPYLEPEAQSAYVDTPGGKSYLTSHIQLRYDMVKNPSVDFADLFFLFYYLAPIHLVLERIVGEIVGEPPTIPRVNALSHFSMHKTAAFTFEPIGEINRRAVIAAKIDLHLAAYFNYNEMY